MPGLSTRADVSTSGISARIAAATGADVVRSFSEPSFVVRKVTTL